MIRCLLFGHKPSEVFEFARYHGVHSHTYCERCGLTVTHPVPDDRPFAGVGRTLEEVVGLTAEKTAARIAELSAAPACWHDRERAKRPAKTVPLASSGEERKDD